jgi:hypothetical protein
MAHPLYIHIYKASGNLYQHQVGYTKQAQHKPSARVKTNIKRLHMYEAQHQIGYTNQAQHKPSARVKTNIKKTPHV